MKSSPIHHDDVDAKSDSELTESLPTSESGSPVGTLPFRNPGSLSVQHIPHAVLYTVKSCENPRGRESGGVLCTPVCLWLLSIPLYRDES